MKDAVGIDVTDIVGVSELISEKFSYLLAEIVISIVAAKLDSDFPWQWKPA